MSESENYDDESKNVVSDVKVFVGGIPYSSTEDNVRTYFEQIGEVVNVEIPQNPKGSSRGFALVEFKNPDSAKLAISKLHDTELDGRSIVVRPDGQRTPRTRDNRRGGRGGGRGRGGSRGGGRGGNRHSDDRRPPRSRSPPAHRPGFQVYVNNFPWSTTWQDLRELFSKYGEVAHASVVRDGSGRSRGFGSVRFVREEDMLAAIDGLNDTEYNGRTLTVRKDRYQE